MAGSNADDKRAHKVRSLEFASREGNRYWWFRQKHTRYVPPLYSFLNEEEWELLSDWYHDTDAQGLGGECNVPALSVIQGFVMGSGLRNVVQCGHYLGYSTILLGYMMRAMDFKHGVFSVDIDPKVSDYTRAWVSKAGLDDYVHIEVADSADLRLPGAAEKYFGGTVNAVFIDSSHQAGKTRMELDLWYEATRSGGLIFLHDVSEYAREFDSTKQGGVKAGLEQWQKGRRAGNLILLNGSFLLAGWDKLLYGDACGLGIIQKAEESEAGNPG